MENKQLLYNAIKCNTCNTIIESVHRHDFKWCNCIDKDYKVAIDGGKDYSKRSYGSKASYDDLCIYDDGKHETRRDYLRWGVNYDKDMNKLPKTEWRLIKDLETDHIKAILEGGFVEKNPQYKELFEKELKFRNNENT